MARFHRAKEPLVGQKTARLWKRARSRDERSESDRSEEEEYEELDYASDEEAVSEEGAPPAVAPHTGGAFPAGGVTAQKASGDAGILDPQGNPLFDPDDLRHPRSAEWEPPEHIARYIALRMRTPLSRESRSKLRAECPRPSVPGSACKTPEVDPQIAQFLNKSGWKQKKGLDFSLRHCQDKIMDTIGPLSKAYEVLEAAKAGDAELDIDVVIGWVQRAICLLGNANMAVSAERRKAILLKIDPKLATMAVSEPGPSAEGMLLEIIS
ncbi:Hypothetical predicted protein [Pelobates cultripes]|uniref:Uncharacterized protein n=1 Tax=Pelobates cultripes TaxID=61616 RepID=A0AAD1RG33_PELCU|nr:Hypothetical predicted protein [Pelobates cultripes]